LGGSGTYFCLAASYFSIPSLVSVVGNDFTAAHKKIYTGKKIDLSGLQISRQKTLAWGAEYGFDLNTRKVLFTKLNALAEFSPRLSKSQQNCGYVFLSSVSPEQQMQVLAQTKKIKFLGWDTISFWIHRDKKGLEKSLRPVDCCFINDTEARELSGEHNLVKASKKLLGKMIKKNKTLIIKRGEYGLLMFRANKIFHLPGYPLEDVVDPTGAGDSFAGGFMGYIAKTGDYSWKNLKRACVAGSVMASFCVEKLGIKRLLEINKADIETRSKEFKHLTHFES
jgi:sugar/nucleoside kinase (ribokinase family)